MMNGLIGKKLGMSRLFIEQGKAVPVTIIEAGPVTVTQKKSEESDGYNALQVGFGTRKKVNRPQTGHLQPSGKVDYALLKEFRMDDVEEYNVGEEITLDIFEIGDKVNVSGVTKGRGFSGVMKRHGFSGGSASHGCTTKRSPGSIGMAATPARVLPGKRMAGQYGADTQTVRNLEIMDVREEYGVILVKGAVPGPRNGVVLIKKR